MQFNLKNVLLISALHLVSVAAFSQTTEPEPAATKQEPAVVEEQEPIYDIVDEPAEFPGGLAALKRYMMENLKYPQTAVEMGLQGKVFLQFYILEDGSITGIKIKKGVVDCPECDAEAVRLVKSMPKWKPGKVNGKAVNSTFSLPVSFKLN